MHAVLFLVMHTLADDIMFLLIVLKDCLVNMPDIAYHRLFLINIHLTIIH